MPRQFGKVDISAGWKCPRCPHKHGPHAVCPPVGVWLVLVFCGRCNPKAGAYCSRHGHRPPAYEPVAAEVPEQDVQQLAAGDAA